MGYNKRRVRKKLHTPLPRRIELGEKVFQFYLLDDPREDYLTKPRLECQPGFLDLTLSDTMRTSGKQRENDYNLLECKRYPGCI
jgi:hypothetical protein